MQSVFTGVSTGIGWAVTKILIERGSHAFGSMRKKTDAERLKKVTVTWEVTVTFLNRV
jgi:NAD(P)-dependent dehydrogenase (short-subunit alcohol dehydrogenase family)